MTQSHLFENTEYGGVPLTEAKRAMILVHGRGDASDKMSNLAKELGADKDLALVFPKATNNTWYPKGFMAQTEENQPWLDSALENLGKVMAHVKSHGITEANIFLLGFSQGACLTLEYTTINAAKYAGIMILSGGLIGPVIDTTKYQNSFNGTEILIGCSDIDHHIPLSRLEESKEVTNQMGANVDYRIYPGMDHLVNEDEKQKIREMIK
jgi:predicted esterase